MLRQRFIIALLAIGAVAAYPTPSAAAFICKPKPPYRQTTIGGSTMCVKLSTGSVEGEVHVASPNINPVNTVVLDVQPQAMKPEAGDPEKDDDIGPAALTTAQRSKFPRGLAICQNVFTRDKTARIRRSDVPAFSDDGVCGDIGRLGDREECTAILDASPVPEEGPDLTATIASQFSAPTPCNPNEILLDYVPKFAITATTFSQDPKVFIQQQSFCKLKVRLRSLIVYDKKGEPLIEPGVLYKCINL